MSTLSYDALALSWSLDSKSDRLFKIIALLVVFTLLTTGLIISSIPLPKEERKARQEVSPRIVQLLLEKKRRNLKSKRPNPGQNQGHQNLSARPGINDLSLR